MNADDWHPIGFYKKTTRGWRALIEFVTAEPISFEELVARYNWLLNERHSAPYPVADAATMTLRAEAGE